MSFFRKFSSIEDTPRIKTILINQVRFDGIGDFLHLVDIYNYLTTNQKTNDSEFVLLISYGLPEHLDKIKFKLQEIHVPLSICFLFPLYSGNFVDEIQGNKELVEHFKSADQVIEISHGGAFDLYSHKRLFKKGVVVKFIHEHEDRIGYSLGLGDGCYGIKLRRVPRSSLESVTGIIKSENPEFIQRLFSLCLCKDAPQFSEKFLLIPAYFNKYESVAKYIHFLSLIATDKNFGHKDFVIYLSGKLKTKRPTYTDLLSQYNDEGADKISMADVAPEAKVAGSEEVYSSKKAGSFFYYNFWRACQEESTDEQFQKDLHHSNINRIEVYECGRDNPLILSGNPKGKKVIRIFYGFQTSDLAYEAIYSQALVAGISGDNTFEQAISTDIFPYYCSTNALNKRKTFEGIIKIINQIDELSSSVKEMYTAYFNFIDLWGVFNEPEDDYQLKLKRLDFSILFTYWPIVCRYLERYFNFYNQLESIYFEGIRPNETHPQEIKYASVCNPLKA